MKKSTRFWRDKSKIPASSITWISILLTIVFTLGRITPRACLTNPVKLLLLFLKFRLGRTTKKCNKFLRKSFSQNTRRFKWPRSCSTKRWSRDRGKMKKCWKNLCKKPLLLTFRKTKEWLISNHGQLTINLPRMSSSTPKNIMNDWKNKSKER